MKKQFSFFMLLITVCVISAKASNNKKVNITSTMRSVRKYAEIMYNQTKKYGAQAQYKLYSSNGDKIIDVYVSQENLNSNKETIMYIYSAYRCTTDNNDSKRHTVRTTTNHMDDALDLHFKKDGIRTSSVDDMEAIRKDFFCKYMGAPEGKKNNIYYFGWETNKIGLEPKKFRDGGSGATSWVHVDVREFNSIYKANSFFIKEKTLISSQKMADIAIELKLTNMCNCTKK